MKFLLTGDYFFDYQDNQNDFNAIDVQLKDYDFVVINYEGSLKSRNILKKSVNLSMSEKSVNFLNNNLVFCLANNHIMDYDEGGYNKVRALIKSKGYKYFGLESRKGELDNYTIVEKDGLMVCIASFGWVNEECVLSKSDSPGIVNLTNRNIERFFNEIKKSNYDKLIVYIHCGYEYEYYPLPLHVGLFRKMVDLGADFIYSSHSHIIQPYEIYRSKYIFYGLGNFYFSSRREAYPTVSDIGLLLELSISKDNILVSPKYIRYDRETSQSVINNECDYLKRHMLSIDSFKKYSDEYRNFRLRKKNPRPILYMNHEFMNTLKFKTWRLIVDITGLLGIRKIVKKILGWG
jgi:hypothetical protein